MITIYELEKKSTPERWEYWGDGKVIISDLSCASFSNETDARLAVHYQNNYMKALEGLKTANSLLLAYMAFDDGKTGLNGEPLISNLKKLIIKLENVNDIV